MFWEEVAELEYGFKAVHLGAKGAYPNTLGIERGEFYIN
jgi:hypothetical protein